MQPLNLLVIHKEGSAVSIPRATLVETAVEGDTVVCKFVDNTERRIGPYESNAHAVQVFSEIVQALASGMLILDIWRTRPLK